MGSPLGSHDIFFPWGRYFFPPIIMEVESLGVLESDVWCLVSKPGLFSTSMIMGGRVFSCRNPLEKSQGVTLSNSLPTQSNDHEINV